MGRYKILIFAIFAVVMATAALPLRAQTEVQMINGDTVYVDACITPTGTIYDDGGPNGNYSNSFEGWVVIEANAGQTITLQGQYTLESPSYDWIDIWDGPVGQGTQLVYHEGYSGTFNITATSGTLSLFFRTDGSVTYGGFALEWNVEGAGGSCESTASGLTVSSITATTAHLAWDGDAAEYNIRVDGYLVATTTGTSYNLTGLVANMSHTVNVAPVGDSILRCCTSTATFRTACGTVGLPYEDGFENGTVGLMPLCWIKSTNYDDPSTQPQVVSAPGSHLAMMLSCGPNATGGHFGMVVSPTVSSQCQGGAQQEAWRVSFRLRTTHSGTHVVVGFCDSTSSVYEMYGFVPMDTITLYNYDNWADYSYTWTLPEGGCRVAFYMLRSLESGNLHCTYIDDLKIERCGVYGMSNYHTDDSSTIVQWSTFGMANVTLGVRRADAMNDMYTVENAVSPYQITGLEPGTLYTVNFYSDCGCIPQSSDAGHGLLQSLRFQTPSVDESRTCMVLATEPASSFSFIHASNINFWGDNYISASMSDGDSAYIVGPYIGQLAGREMMVDLNGYYCHLEIGIMEYADDRATFVSLGSAYTDYYDSRHLLVRVPDSAAGHYPALRFAPYDVTVYDFRVGDCLVDSLRVARVRGTSVTLAWAEGTSDTVIVEYGPYGFAHGEGDTVYFIDTTAGRIDGLNTGTSYDFYLFRPCDTNDCRHQKLTPTTSEYDYSMPYCEDFEDTYFSWERWYETSYYNSYPSLGDEYFYGDYWGALRFGAYGFDWGYYTEVRLPDIELVAPAYLSFMATDYAPDGYFLIGFTQTGWFDTVETVQGGRHHYTVAIPDSLIADGSQLMMRYNHRTQYQSYRSYVDEVQVASVAYEGLQFIHVGHDSAIAVLGTVGSPADTTIALVRPNGTDTIYGQYVADSNYWVFAGLDSGTTYYCYVQLDSGCLSLADMIRTQSSGGSSGYRYCYDFDDLLSYELPRDWLGTDGGYEIDDSDEPMTVGGGQCLRMANGAAMASHPINNPGGQYYWLTARCTAGDGKAVVFTVPSDSLTGDYLDLIQTDTIYTSSDTIDLGPEWSRIHVHIPALAEGTYRLCFEALNDSVEVDNVSLHGCPPIDFEVVGNTLVCTTPPGYSPWYYLSFVDSTGIDTREEIMTESPMVVEELRLDRGYELTWHCTGDGDGDCYNRFGFHTGGAVALPYCEEFNSMDYEGNVNIPREWQFVYSHEGELPHIDPYYGRLVIGSANHPESYQYVVMPPVDATGMVHMSVQYFANQSQIFELGTMDAGDTSSFVTLESSISEYAENSISVQVPALGHKRLAIRTKGYEFELIRVAIDQNPEVSVELINSRTLRLTASYDTSYYIQYSNSYSTNIRFVTTSPYLLQLPESYNNITLRVVSDADGTSCGNADVSLQLSDRKALPYCIGFNSGWSDWYLKSYWRQSSPGYTYDMGYQSYRFDSYNNDQMLQFLLLPDINIDSIRRLAMRLRMYATSPNDKIEVGVMTDAYDTNTFTPVDTIECTSAGEWGLYTMRFDSYSGDGRWITFRHRGSEPTDGHYWEYLYIDDLVIDTCLATTATATLIDWHTVQIDNIDTGVFYVEYGPEYFWQGSGAVVRVDSLPLFITLPASSEFDFYFICDSNSSSCVPPQYIHTFSTPLEVPTCIDFEDIAAGQLYNEWNSIGYQSYVSADYGLSGSQSLLVRDIAVSPTVNVESLQGVGIGFDLYAVNGADKLVVGCMSDPYDVSSFTALRTITPPQGMWVHYDVSYSDAPNDAYFIAFRCLSHDGYYSPSLYIDNLSLVSCGAFDLHMANVEDDNVTIDWGQVGEPSITVTVMQGGNTMAVLHPTAPPLNISPLVPGADYSFVFSAVCSSGTSECSAPYNDTINVVAVAASGDCINPTDLSSPNAVFYSGTYSNPYAASGAIDFGSNSIDSRHTVCSDTSARDPRTGNQLRLVPEGATASVRLGNWGSNILSPEAEGATYSLFVDTLSFNLILMRYAAVLQDPMHAAEDQPRFRLEVLDSAFNLIDPQCASADFVANRNLGWNEAPNNVLWKDWTAFGVDLSNYANQNIYLRLTTYDCNEGSHYGYAYFTLECMRRSIVTDNCGSVDSNTLTAPIGFNYNWYSSLSPAVFSNDQSVTVPVGEVTYYCDVVSKENANCYFTLSAYAGTRYPLASFDTSCVIRNCGFDVRFTNTSAVSADGVNPLESGEMCESAYWDFGNGESSTSYHAGAHYDAPGIYNVTLVSGIAGDACTDTFTFVMDLEFPPNNPRIEGPDEICAGDSATLTILDAVTLDPMWPDGQQTVAPRHDSTLSVFTIDPSGCTHTLQHDITVHPSFYFLDTLWLCSTQLPFAYADTVYQIGTTEAIYSLNQSTIFGCDSNYYLQLTVSNSTDNIIFDTVNATICDNQSWAFFGNQYTEAGTYHQHHLNEEGLCDSLHTLFLDVNATSATDTFAIECDTFMWHDTLLVATTTAPLPYIVLSNSDRCDSTVTLHLTVNYSSSSTISHTIVENQLPYNYIPMGVPFTFYSDTAECLLTVPNSVGCDSNITFNLTVYWNVDTAIDSTVCENLLPVIWNGVTFAAAGIDSTILAAHTGADSNVVMTLNVLYNSTATAADTIMQNDLPAYTPPLPVDLDIDTAALLSIPQPLVTVVDSIVIIPNAVGCDSIVHYTLTLYHNYHSYDTIHICRHEMPAVYLSDTLDTDDDHADYNWMLTSVYGADSLVSLALIIHPDFELGDTLVFCPSQHYVYEGIDYGGPAQFDAPHLSAYGCDSLVHVLLIPRDTNFHLDIFYSYSGTDWQRPDTVIPVCAPDRLYLLDTTPMASARLWYLATSDTLVTSTDSIFSWPFYIGSDTIDVLAGVVVNTGAECIDTLVWPVAVFARPNADFTWSPEVPANHNPEVQFYNLSQPFDTVGDPSTTYFLWNIPQTPDGTVDTTSEHSPFYHWGEPGSDMKGEYEVSLIEYWDHTTQLYILPTQDWPLGLPPDSMLIDVAHTCTDTAIQTIIITNDFLQFPNLVTPNGDGVNDIWKVVGLLEYGNYSMNELWIYDRTGALVYHVRDIRREEQFWDPVATRSPDGTYYYRFSAKGEYGLVRRNGLIEVVR